MALVLLVASGVIRSDVHCVMRGVPQCHDDVRNHRLGHDARLTKPDGNPTERRQPNHLSLRFVQSFAPYPEYVNRPAPFPTGNNAGRKKRDRGPLARSLPLQYRLHARALVDPARHVEDVSEYLPERTNVCALLGITAQRVDQLVMTHLVQCPVVRRFPSRCV